VEVRSGNGVHAYWLLTKAVGCDKAPRVEQALRRLADLVGGDPAVAEVSRLMRLPGTHNSKNGAWKPVTIEAADCDRRYELDELEEMVVPCLPRISRKPSRTSRLNGAANQFLALGLELGTGTPIDVQQRLTAMRYQGPGDSSIHQTQLQLSASLLSRGCSVDEVTSVLIDATRNAAGEHGTGWDWNREERAVRALCADWSAKRIIWAARWRTAPELGTHNLMASRPLPTTFKVRRPPRGCGAGTVRSMRMTCPTRSPTPSFNALRREGHDLLLTEGEVFFTRRASGAL
jgi:RepB DNA-primase from phage plasmid